MRYTKLTRCRICGNRRLEPVLDLGEQMLTGVFPKQQGAAVTIGPLQLVKCMGGTDACGLLQLAHSYSLEEMYGDNYGYRSGLNQSMVAHLHRKVNRIRTMVNLKEGDLVVDIGSNDGTTLAAYPESIDRLGIDPTAGKFAEFYPAGSRLISEFFGGALVADAGLAGRARVVTSFSMFYDLEDPLQFMRDIHSLLDEEGLWVFEQSYLPAMLATNSYDTVCHEHLEYYSLQQIKWMADRTGFTLVDIEFNDINGGSFSVAASKSSTAVESWQVREVLEHEEALGLRDTGPFREFAERVVRSREALREFLQEARTAGRSVAALGASTKGNVLLQYCGLDSTDIQCIGEVNPEKFGAFTPGTWIPVVPEKDLLATHPDYLIVLPWHFRAHFLSHPAFAECVLVFPLPQLEVCDRRIPAA